VNKFWLLSVLFFSFNVSWSNDLPISLLGGEKSVTIPFEFVAGYAVVNVRINGRPPISLIFDTGAQHSLFFDPEYARTLGLPLSDTITVMGSDMSTKMDAYICRESYLHLEGTTEVKHDILFLSERIDILDHAIGRPIQGILGISFFGNLSIQIDYIKGRILLIDPEYLDLFTRKYPIKQKLVMIDNRPHLPYCKSDGSTGLALLDTGAAISLSTFITSEDELPETWIPSVLGQGIGGNIYGYLGIESKLIAFDTPFSKVVTRYQLTEEMEKSAETIVEQRDALIGNSLISQFDLILDLLNHEVYIKPNRRYKPESRYNKSGLQLLAYGYKFHKIYVQSVDIRSPAFLEDIREGDYIISCNLLKGRLLTLNSLYKKFTQKKNKKLKLKLLRDGRVLKKCITLSPYLG